MIDPQPALGLPGPRISRITIARLHNLGNFEHCRLELTCELPAGTSPSSVLREMNDLLEHIQPKPPVGPFELGQAIKLLQAPAPVPPTSDEAAADDDPFESPQEKYRRLVREREMAERAIARHQAWSQQREAALKRFDELGGIVRHTSARDRDEG